MKIQRIRAIGYWLFDWMCWHPALLVGVFAAALSALFAFPGLNPGGVE